jgi:hypothetical protein
MKKIIFKIITFFKSLRLTTTLIIYAILLLIITSFVPLSPDNYILKFIFYQVPFFLFFINLLTCTVLRFKKKKKNIFNLAPDIIHTGLIILMAGYFISAYFEQSYIEYLKPGDMALIDGKYSIKLESFTGTGTEEEWISEISLTESNKPVELHQIRSNHPLMLGNINIYQYYSLTSEVLLYLRDNSDSVYIIKPDEGFMTEEYYYIFSNAYDTVNNKKYAVFKVWNQEKSLDDKILTKGDRIELFTIEDIEITYCSGLKIVKDSGIIIIFISFMIISSGILLLLIKRLINK